MNRLTASTEVHTLLYEGTSVETETGEKCWDLSCKFDIDNNRKILSSSTVVFSEGGYDGTTCRVRGRFSDKKVVIETLSGQGFNFVYEGDPPKRSQDPLTLVTTMEHGSRVGPEWTWTLKYCGDGGTDPLSYGGGTFAGETDPLSFGGVGPWDDGGFFGNPVNFKYANEKTDPLSFFGGSVDEASRTNPATPTPTPFDGGFTGSGSSIFGGGRTNKSSLFGGGGTGGLSLFGGGSTSALSLFGGGNTARKVSDETDRIVGVADDDHDDYGGHEYVAESTPVNYKYANAEEESDGDEKTSAVDEYSGVEYVDYQEIENLEPVAYEDPGFFNELGVTTSIGTRHGAFKYVSYSDLSKIGQIGKGNFGDAFRASWNGSDVVIKAPKSTPSKDEETELASMMRLPQHPNIVELLGCCTDFWSPSAKEKFPSLVLRYMKNKDLKSFLKRRSEPPSTEDYVNVVLGMARGIAHLHDNGLVHRDIALRNFLVGDDGRIMAADFGLSRSEPEDDDEYYYAAKDAAFPWKWCAPETLVKRKSTLKSDIWMFGATIAEIFGDLFPKSKIMEHVITISNPNFKLQVPDSCPELLKTVAQQCCQNDPLKRPTIHEIIDMLGGQAGDAQQKEVGKGSSPKNDITIEELFESLKLSKHVKKFTDEDIDIEELRELTDEELNDFDLTKGARKKIKRYIASCKQ